MSYENCSYFGEHIEMFSTAKKKKWLPIQRGKVVDQKDNLEVQKKTIMQQLNNAVLYEYFPVEMKAKMLAQQQYECEE